MTMYAKRQSNKENNSYYSEFTHSTLTNEKYTKI